MTLCAPRLATLTSIVDASSLWHLTFCMFTVALSSSPESNKEFERRQLCAMVDGMRNAY